MVYGINDIPIKARDAFAAAKIWKNGPYLVKSYFSKFLSVMADVSLTVKQHLPLLKKVVADCVWSEF